MEIRTTIILTEEDKQALALMDLLSLALVKENAIERTSPYRDWASGDAMHAYGRTERLLTDMVRQFCIINGLRYDDGITSGDNTAAAERIMSVMFDQDESCRISDALTYLVTHGEIR